MTNAKTGDVRAERACVLYLTGQCIDDSGCGMMRVEQTWGTLGLSGRQVDMRALAKRVCKSHDISVGEQCSGSRRHEIVEARGIVCWIAVRELGCSGADVAWFLGVANSRVTRSVSSGKRCEVEDYINHVKKLIVRVEVFTADVLRTFCTNVPFRHSRRIR